ncbi:MAG: tRNA lysidine(34) synthetase TilS [Cyclobacteriaceae bacterium]
MLEYFLSFIHEHLLVRDGERTLVAVSGGVDSMVMADLFLQSPFSFAVTHVNFGLRGEESNKDEALVREWCASRQVPCFVQHAPSQIFEHSDSTQMAARDFRYQYFDVLMQKEGFHKLATAHHLDDSLETALFNFTKGTGLRGLQGISAIKGDIIRPLLFAGKEDIIAYAKERKICWREDATNRTDAYQRNKIRHQVIPALKSINPGLLRTFTSVAQRVTDARELIEEIVQDLLRNHKHVEGSTTRIAMKWMSQYQHTGAILHEMLREYGFSYVQARQIQASVVSENAGKLFYSDLYELNVDREQLVIKEKQAFLEENKPLRVPGVTIIGKRWIDADIISGNEISDVNDPCIAYFDLDKLKSAKVTHWKEGDTFNPLGMKGKKKVSDFMIDSKIPLTLKKDVLILRSQEEIAWIIGYRLDDRFKVTAETKKMLRLQLHSDV